MKKILCLLLLFLLPFFFFFNFHDNVVLTKGMHFNSEIGQENNHLDLNELLFSDDFEDWGENWTEESGDWICTNGRYVGSADENDTAFTTGGDNTWKNYTISSYLWINDESYSGAVMFRIMNTSTEPDRGRYYYVELNPKNESMILWRANPSSDATKLEMNTTTISVGNRANVTISVEGKRVKIWNNLDLMIDYNNLTDYSSGSIGLRVAKLSEVEFDNIQVVSEPDKEVLYFDNFNKRSLWLNLDGNWELENGILVCNSLSLPNASTIIVEDADYYDYELRCSVKSDTHNGSCSILFQVYYNPYFGHLSYYRLELQFDSDKMILYSKYYLSEEIKLAEGYYNLDEQKWYEVTIWNEDSWGTEDIRSIFFINDELVIDGNFFEDSVYGSLGLRTESFSRINFDNITLRISDNESPNVTNPDDIFYEEETTGNFIEWIAEDDYPSIYSITIDGILVDYGEWENNEPIVLNVDDMEYGRYKVIIHVFDRYENLGGDNLYINVYEPFNTDTPTNKTNFQFMTLVVVMLLIEKRRRGKLNYKNLKFL